MDDPLAAQLDSGSGWKVFHDPAYSFTPVSRDAVGGYYAAAPGEVMDARLHPWGWQNADFDDRAWAAARPVTERPLWRGAHAYGEGGEWQLVARNIPAMEERPVRFASIRRTEGVTAPAAFVRGTSPLLVPPGRKISLLLDQGELTMGYPRLVTSGGRGASIKLTFAEGLVDAKGHKGNRAEIAGKTIRGLEDRFFADGGERRPLQSLWLRTWRYVQVHVETTGEPLTIHDIGSTFTAYPFRQRAAFNSDRPWIAQVWDIDWRVFRLSAFETFWDTPYYEQLQYVGDSRIEALLSLYNAGDDRLMRNAIEQFDASRTPDGLTASRYPSSTPQYIPPFSLWWVAMVHDHAMHRDDPAFVRRFLPRIGGVFGWYERHLDETGLLGPMPWWNFVDWTYERGVPPGAEKGNSTTISLQLAYVLRLASELEQSFGNAAEAQRYSALSDRINMAARTRSWDQKRGLFADTPEKRHFSQQTNALAILSGAVAPGDRAAVMQRLLTDEGLTPASYYFRFYVDEALRQSGMADLYLERLEPWREMIRLGLTTTLEEPEPSRSDSHAWSAHPNYHLLATVLGIRPAEAGFRTVSITPALGPLKRASGQMPHPNGTIAVQLRRTGRQGIVATVDLPPGTPGTFIWKGVPTPLKPGRNEVRR